MRSVCVVQEPQHVVSGLLGDDSTPLEKVFRRFRSDRFSLADPVDVVGVGDLIIANFGFHQPAAFPCEIHPTVRKRIADLVVGDPLSVVGGEQIRPVFIAINIAVSGVYLAGRPRRVGVLLNAGDVPALVVGVNCGNAAAFVIRADELIYLIVGVLRHISVGVFYADDVSVVVVFVAVESQLRIFPVNGSGSCVIVKLRGNAAAGKEIVIKLRLQDSAVLRCDLVRFRKPDGIVEVIHRQAAGQRRFASWLSSP